MRRALVKVVSVKVSASFDFFPRGQSISNVQNAKEVDDLVSALLSLSDQALAG